MKELDAIVIGAGVTGLYQLYRLRELGLDAEIYEAGTGGGGTWYWNRYPGARFDSESYTYGYEFSEELLQEWEWKEHFAGQPETERYLNYVTDKFDLRPHIRFRTRVKSTVFDESDSKWLVSTENGEEAKARYIIAAVGILSAHHFPSIPGIADYEGLSFHTSRWPKEKMDFEGKRVAVIGTGATAVQLIPEIAKEVGHLTVFQRTPNWCLPLLNSEIDAETQKEIKASYPEIFKRCRETYAGFIHDADPRSALEVDEKERTAHYEEIWAERGFAKWHGNFHDVMTDKAANATYVDFISKKIRERVNDPAVADLLIPKDHAFGTKRVPMETRYYEAYNRDNVTLLDSKTYPITKVTSRGIDTTNDSYEFDVIIYATGFDAVTGELSRLDVRGKRGQTLNNAWSDGPKTNLTLMAAGFPNFFTATGAVFCNVPRCAEVAVDWVADCIAFLERNELKQIETTEEAAETWTREANELPAGFLLSTESNISSWYYGNNIPGKAKTFSLYAGGATVFREKTSAIASEGYPGFVLS